MKNRDLSFTLAAAVLTALFLPPTLKNFGLYDKIPYPLLVVYIGFPIVCFVGMFVLSKLAKIIPLLWQFGKFALVGVLNTTIDFGILNFLIARTEINSGVGLIVLNASSFAIATINSYFWNKQWVFVTKKKTNFISFLIVSVIGIGLNSATVFLLSTYVPPVFGNQTQWVNIAKVVATAVSLIWNFVGYKLIVFR